jgi:exodeoxyribonuclease-3
MRIATWNINSVRTREARVRDFLARADVDVLCLQETKCTDAQFPDFSDTGYAQAHCGDGSFNGVALLSRVGLDGVRTDFGQPGFAKDPDGRPGPRAAGDRRHLRRCGGLEPVRPERPGDPRPAFHLQARLPRRPGVLRALR